MRVIRLLVYDGPEDFIQKTMERNAVKGRTSFGHDKSITSIILGTLPDELELTLKALEATDANTRSES